MLTTHRRSALFLAVFTLTAAAGVTPAAAGVDAKRILGAAENNSEWLTHGHTYDEQRYSSLANIDQSNVKDLKLAWYLDVDTSRGQEATALVVDGTSYFTTAWSKVFAADARTGKENGASIRRSQATRQSMRAATS
jgi:glucose dehydrogenase